MELYIAEKPSLAKTLAEHLAGGKKVNRTKYYIEGDGWMMTWCVGHLFELADPALYDERWGRSWSLDTLPIIPEKFKYVPSKSKVDLIKNIHALCAKATKVYNCGDPDREGQALVDMVINTSPYKGQVFRVWPDNLSESGLNAVFKKIRPNSEFVALGESAVCRAQADWLVGLNFTRLYTCMAQKKGHTGVLTIGRVQTPVFSLVYERCKAIENFKSTTHYGIRATFQYGDSSYTGDWVIPDSFKNEEGYLLSRSTTDEIVNGIKGSTALVTSLTKKPRVEKAPLPFSLSTLQVLASKRWGYSAKQVLNACQYLYETLKATTYPRTDCNYLSVGDFDIAQRTLSIALPVVGLTQSQVCNEISFRPRCYDDTKTTAHTAIVPTDQAPDFSIFEKESAAAQKAHGFGNVEVIKNIYKAVTIRYAIQFMQDHQFLETVIMTSAKNNQFRTKGKQITLNGWKDLEADTSLQKDNVDDDGLPIIGGVLPSVSEGDNVKTVNAETLEKKTSPPEYFTDGSLIDAMMNIARYVDDPNIKSRLKETDGIGTEATRGDIIEKIKAVGYVANDKKKIKLTDLGERVYPSLPNYFKSPNMTAVWENILKSISEGTTNSSEFRQRMLAWTRSEISSFIENTPDIDVGIEVKYTCKKCNGSLFKRKGKYGFFWACSNDNCKAMYKDFKNAPLFPSANEGSPCPTCKKGKLKTRVMKGNREKGTIDRLYDGCTNYPDCKHLDWLE